MRKLLYTLLAMVISSGAPAAEPVEDFPLDSGDESTDVLPSSADRRVRSPGWPDCAESPDVLVLPVESFDPADHGPDVAGSVQVEHGHAGVTDVRCLETLDTPWRDLIAARLLDAALAGCRDDGALKVRIDLPLPVERVTEQCRKCRFNYWRTVTREGRRIHEFYADLYTAPGEDRAPETPAA